MTDLPREVRQVLNARVDDAIAAIYDAAIRGDRADCHLRCPRAGGRPRGRAGRTGGVVDVTRYGRKRRRTVAWYADHPRAFEDAVAAHDLAELERHDAEQMEREPRDDRFEREAAKWLTPVDPADFESAA